LTSITGAAYYFNTKLGPKLGTREKEMLAIIEKSIGYSDKIEVDAEKMGRVFLNLMQNAFDAMPQGGTRTIANQKSNGNLQISFVDSVVGMKKEIVKNLCNPLFTTKAKGMVLGLSAGKRFVEGHESLGRVESQPGEAQPSQ